MNIPPAAILNVGGNFKIITMNNYKSFIRLLPFLFCLNTAFSQKPKVELPGTEVIQFKSAINDRDYVLDIALPNSYSDTTKRFPVLYALDGQWSFPGVSGNYGGLNYDGFVPEMIVVGIGWKDDYFNNRDRDFSQTYIQANPNSGGASKFLKVIKNEIIKLIDSSYRTQPNNNTLTGGSSGGVFALYALFLEPALFTRYVIGSPSLENDDSVIFKIEKEFSKTNHELNAKIFFSVGEYEEPLKYVSRLDRFTKQLKASNYKGLEFESMVVEKTGHGSEGSYGFVRGLQYVFSKPELILDAALLDSYTGHYAFGPDTATISRSGNNLYQQLSWGKIELYAETPQKFYVKGMTGSIEFKKDSNNEVTGFDFTAGDNKFFVKKID